MRKCPFAGCDAHLPDHLFACGRHWGCLTRPQQRRIHDAYNAYMKEQIGLKELRSRQQSVIDETGFGGNADA